MKVKVACSNFPTCQGEKFEAHIKNGKIILVCVSCGLKCFFKINEN
jgi:ssDNA-binding Zn-finger/Zn-ribbon topoisomerase 1